MAVSGLEQRNIPLLIVYPVWSPWGPGLTEPLDSGMEDASDKDSTAKLGRRRRSLSWGNYSPHALASRCSSRSTSASDSDSNDISDPDSSERQTPGIDNVTLCQPVQRLQREKSTFLATRPNRDQFHAAGNQQNDACRKTDSESKNEVTSMMVRNLPSNLTQQQFIDALHATGFASLFDFCYLPRKFSHNTNMGYAFVNFVNPTAAKEFRRIWNQDKGSIFNISNARKSLNVSEAAMQGRHANMKKAQSKKMSRVRNNSFKPLLLDVAMPVTAAPSISVS